MTGKKSISAAVGINSKSKAAADGCIALMWRDKENERPRLSVGYIGENLKADTWYAVDEKGNFIETKGE
jgi:hypothetical protein